MRKLFVWFFFFVDMSLQVYGSSLEGDITTLANEKSLKIARILQENEATIPQNSSGSILSKNGLTNSSTSDNNSDNNANASNTNPISDESEDNDSFQNIDNDNPSSEANHTVIIVVAVVCAICIIGLALLLLRIRTMRNAQLAHEAQHSVELNNSGTITDPMRTNESFQVFDRRNDSVIINIDTSTSQSSESRAYPNKEIL